MTESHEKQTIPALISDAQGRSVWVEHSWPTEARGGMVLTPRVGCSSLRLRRSAAGYASDWHVADEPVLIVVRSGVLSIALRDETTRRFGPGDAFIAADRVLDGDVFDHKLHGHRGQVVGDQAFEAVHIKLDPAGLNFDR